MERNIPFPSQIGAGRKGYVGKKSMLRIVAQHKCRIRGRDQCLPAARDGRTQGNERIIHPLPVYLWFFLDMQVQELYPYPDDISFTRGVDVHLIRRNKGARRILSKQANRPKATKKTAK